MKKFVKESIPPILMVVVLLISIVGMSIFVVAMEKSFNNSSTNRANIIVDINGNGHYTSIQEAINHTNPGDSIYVWAGIYYENILINRSVSLIGNGTSNSIINGSLTGDVVYITANSVKISGFTITYSGIRDHPYDDSGIELNYVSNVHIFKNNVSNNKIGIYLNNSDYNLIEDNLVGWSGDIGISCMNSNYNRLLRNNCSFTFFGLGIIYGSNNSAIDNICISNSWSGLLVSDTRDNYVARNKCLNGNSGLEMWFSTNNDITNNSVIGNSYCGIALGYAQKNFIQNNTIERNDYAGIRMEDSNFNSITKNNISTNLYGVYVESNSCENTIFDNIISVNLNIGISIEKDCNNTKIYNNNIISNPIQAQDKQITTNKWFTDEGGNYWSDYTGVDNGMNNRICGDGIGDTLIPHLGLDWYPFINLDGWIYPGIPMLIIEREIDCDGNYNVSWSNDPRAIDYVFEEDITDDFSSPVVYNDGWVPKGDNNTLCFKNKPEETYYYRIRAVKENYQSDWSKSVNVTVDHLPEVPKNLQVSVYPGGNGLNLTWDLNIKDTVDYELYCQVEGISGWEMITNVSHPYNTYDHGGLVDCRKYHYKLRSYDARSQSSIFSDEITAVPNDSTPPDAPTGLRAEAKSQHEITITWSTNNESDLEGYEIYMNDTTYTKDQKFKLIYTADENETSYTINDLNEQVSYSFKIRAFDEIPNNSPFSHVVTASTPDLTCPSPPTNVVISNNTDKSLLISWTSASDLDVIGYYVFRSLGLSGPYENVTKTPIQDTKFLSMDLQENTQYYFHIRSIDDVGLISLPSEVSLGRTLFRPRPPQINNSIKDFNLREDTIDNISINLYYLFKDINGDTMTFNCEGQEHIKVTMFIENGTVELIPEHNWNGRETLTFFANDGVFSNSTMFVLNVTVKGVNDPPDAPIIISPPDNLEIKEGEPITLSANCTDPDLEYGDYLKYVWSSNLSGRLGTGQELKDIVLQPGHHELIVEVTDSGGRKEISSVSIRIKEMQSNEEPKKEVENSNLFLFSGITILIIGVLLFLFKRKKWPFKIKVDNDKNGIKENVENKDQINYNGSSIIHQNPHSTNTVQNSAYGFNPELFNQIPQSSYSENPSYYSSIPPSGHTSIYQNNSALPSDSISKEE